MNRSLNLGRTWRLLSMLLVVLLPSLVPVAASAQGVGQFAGTAMRPQWDGYWTVTDRGKVEPSGGAQSYGDMSARALNRPVVGIASTVTGKGYWLVAGDGGIFSFGDAGFRGSTGAMALNRPIVGMAATPTGHGYWLVASDGGIFAFGDAPFYGSTGSIPLNQPIVGMAATPTGDGYWLVASDGGIFAFGGAQFYGSTGGTHLNQPVVGMASTATGAGYWLVAADGGIFAYGDAAFQGSGVGIESSKVFGLVPDSGGGYAILRSDGSVQRRTAAKTTAAAAGPSSGIAGNWTMAFDDEFDETALNTSRWRTCFPWSPVSCTHDSNGELQWYRPKNVTSSSGALHLTAKRETYKGTDGKTYSYTSGMVATGRDDTTGAPPKFAFTYGYVEAQVRIPKGTGFWPAVWLLPVDETWPPEIDVAEWIGSAPNEINMYNHWGTEANPQQAGLEWTGPDFSAGWHTVGIDWQPDHITWYVDGVARRTFVAGTDKIPNKPMYLILNLAVGGDWPGAPTASTPFPSSFDVDYVRVWKKA